MILRRFFLGSERGSECFCGHALPGRLLLFPLSLCAKHPFPPPLPFCTVDPESPEASEDAMSLQSLWWLAALSFPAMGALPTWVRAHSTAVKFHLCSHQRPLLSGGNWALHWNQPLMKIQAIPGSAPLFFPIGGAGRERERLWKDSLDHPAGQDTCRGHQAVSNYLMVLLWCDWRNKTHHRSEGKKRHLFGTRIMWWGCLSRPVFPQVSLKSLNLPEGL